MFTSSPRPNMVGASHCSAHLGSLQSFVERRTSSDSDIRCSDILALTEISAHMHSCPQASRVPHGATFILCLSRFKHDNPDRHPLQDSVIQEVLGQTERACATFFLRFAAYMLNLICPQISTHRLLRQIRVRT